MLADMIDWVKKHPMKSLMLWLAISYSSLAFLAS